MNRTQARLALLKYSLLTCAALSVLVFVSIWNTRPDTSISVVPEVVSVVAEVGKEAVARMPATIPRLIKARKTRVFHPGFQVWKAPCLEAASRLKSLSTDSGWFRISADTCDTALEVKESKLENTSNGYVATVFTPTPSHLTSDFIPLVKGPNVLKMELVFGSGETFSYEWTIDRALTATN